MKPRPEYVVVARFGRPRGVSGEIFLVALGDNPERFEQPSTFWMESEEGWRPVQITAVRRISGRPAVKVEGITTADEARELTNQYLYIKGGDLRKLPKGKYYYFDLIGCEVRGEDGEVIGKIVEVESYPANDAWVIETTDKRRCLFPAVKEFVKEVDIDGEVVVIAPPEGIFDSPDKD